MSKCTIGLRGLGSDATFFSPLDIVATADKIFKNCDDDPELGYGGWISLLIGDSVVEDWRVVVYGPRLNGQLGNVDEEICSQQELYSDEGLVED